MSLKKPERKKVETSLEVKAFVYQKLDPFEPYIKEEDDTEVIIEKAELEDGSESYLVTLVLKTEEGELNTFGEGEDVFTAVSDAADGLMSQISLIHNATISTRERDLEIREAYNSQYLH